MTNMVQEFKLESRMHRWWRIRRMWPESMPVDKTWQVIALLLAIWIPIVVLTVRWWMCI